MQRYDITHAEISARFRIVPHGSEKFRFVPHSFSFLVGAPLVGAQTINQFSGQPQGIAPTGVRPTLGEIVGAFKSVTTNEYIRGVKDKGWQPFDTRLWQRNYYEHIIRDQRSYDEISCYILDNPRYWRTDKLYCVP